jgi:hypothetical protein
MTYRVPPILPIAAITNARIRGDDIWSNGYFAWLADVWGSDDGGEFCDGGELNDGGEFCDGGELNDGGEFCTGAELIMDGLEELPVSWAETCSPK